MSSQSLTAIAPDVWGVTNDLFMPGKIHFPVRMTVVRLPSGGLWVHSPVKIDDPVAAELDALGPVEHIVAPNALHHLFFGRMAERYPEATTWAAPSLAKKRDDLRFDHTLGEAEQPWADVLAPIYIEGAPWVEETVFLHRPSRTLIVCDLFFNIHEPANLRSTWMFKMLGVLGRPRQSPLFRRAVKDRPAAVRSVRKILEWEFDRIVPAHGRLVEHDAHQTLTEVLGPMLKWAPKAA